MLRKSSAALRSIAFRQRSQVLRSPYALAARLAAPRNWLSTTAGNETHTFRAETKQLLDIVTNALYTDKHIFLRELISNASDALEKVRHMQVAGESVIDPEKDLKIRISLSESDGTLTIEDDGVGMTHDELIQNLGTIAHSGSKAFLKEMRERGLENDASTGSNIIGMFGVGFYSAFMVGDEVTVQTRSAKTGEGHIWTSSGLGEYSITPADDLARGTRITVHLKDSCKNFSVEQTIFELITKYSNFVNFPIMLNGSQVNTVTALWSRSRSEITEEEYDEFFKYKSGSKVNKAQYRMHFMSEAPIEIKALMYVGETHEESFGLGRMPVGVDLYSRRVLIEQSSSIVPDWLRFLIGVVDSEDIPLNISRESMQDSALMQRIRSVITRRVLRFFATEQQRDRPKYEKFWNNFGQFFKEGIVSDQTYQTDIARLMLCESSALEPGQLTSLDEYIARSPVGQDKIYYIIAPHRGLAESSPYMEAFKGGEGDAGTEVLFLYTPLDDFVMGNLQSYGGRNLLSVEAGEARSAAAGRVDPLKRSTEQSAEDEASGVPSLLSPEQVAELVSFLQEQALPGKLSAVLPSERLVDSPAVVVDHESASVRRMMQIMNDQAKADGAAPGAADHVLPKQTLEINIGHPVIRRLYTIHKDKPDVAHNVAQQLFDNALIAAGLLDDARAMLPRLNNIMAQMLAGVLSHEGPSAMDRDAEGAARRHISDREHEVNAMHADTKEQMHKLQEEMAKSAAGASGSGLGDVDASEILKGMGRSAGRKRSSTVSGNTRAATFEDK